MMRLSTLAALTITFTSTVQAAAGPISTLYLTDGDAGHLFIVNGNSQSSINTNAHGQQQYAIAVQKTVRIFSNYKDSGLNQGAEYTLAGAFTGEQYTNNYGSELLDGTTDGAHNYTIQFPTGKVIQFDTNWAKPSVLFTLPSANRDAIGITYDPANNSLWILDRNNALILDYTLGGTFLSSFSIASGFGGRPLALDPADETLWTFNGGSLVCLDPRATIDIACSLLHQNGPDPGSGCAGSVTDTTSADPLLCNVGAGDFERCSGSPALSPASCGTPFLGAQGEGCPACATTRAVTVTWGALKGRYR